MIDDLWALEEGFFTDLHTAEYVDRLVAESAIAAFEFGRMSKQEWMAAVANPGKPEPFAFSNKDALIVSDDVVILNYIASRYPAGRDPDVRMMSTVFAKASDGWKIVLHHQTPSA